MHRRADFSWFVQAGRAPGARFFGIAISANHIGPAEKRLCRATIIPSPSRPSRSRCGKTFRRFGIARHDVVPENSESHSMDVSSLGVGFDRTAVQGTQAINDHMALAFRSRQARRHRPRFKSADFFL